MSQALHLLFILLPITQSAAILSCRYAKVNLLVEVPMDLERVALIKQRFLTLASCMPVDEFLSGWFLGVPSEQIFRGNVEDFIAYGFYCRKLDALSPEVC